MSTATGTPLREVAVSGKGWRPDLLGEDGPGARGARGMLRVLWAYRVPFGVSVLAGWLQQGLAIAASTVAAYVVALALTGATPGELWPWVGVLAAAVLARAAAVWVESWVSHDLSFRMLAEIRMWIFRALDRIGPGGLMRRRTGDLVARAMSDTEGLEIFYAHTSIYIAVAVLLPPFVLVALLAISPLLALVLLPFMLLTAVAPFWLRAANAGHGREIRERTVAVNTDVVDLIQGVREVLSFGQGQARRRHLDALTDELSEAERRQGVRGGGEVALTTVIVGLGGLCVLVVGAWQTVRGTLPLTLFPPAVVLAATGFLPLLTLLNVTRVYGITAASADRVFDLIDEPAAVSDTGTTTLSADAAEGLPVRFENVHFRYADGLPLAVDGVDLDLAPGETVALVGPSGAGKSTLAHLLLRFFDPEVGRVSIGGVDIRDLPRAELARLAGHVSQDVFLFHDTLAANLRLGAPDATDEQVAAACDAAAVSRFAAELPEGLDTVVGERGARLSGGERQRVAVARALLRDCPVLVLDEAASQLDALSEREVQSALDRLRAGRTTLVIAHRLSTIGHADRVVLLDGGQVLGTGTHEELLAGQPRYHRLVTDQISGAAPEPPTAGSP